MIQTFVSLSSEDFMSLKSRPLLALHTAQVLSICIMPCSASIHLTRERAGRNHYVQDEVHGTYNKAPISLLSERAMNFEFAFKIRILDFLLPPLIM